ncbi:MAG: hypothetical protein AAGG08_07615 [Actinomycetota bacterium]
MTDERVSACNDTADTWPARNRVRVAATVALLMVGLPLAGLTLVVLADQVPDRWIVSELGDGLEDGTFPAEDYARGWTGNRIDQYTDCVGLTAGLGDAMSDDPVSSAIRSWTLMKCSLSAPAVQGFIDGQRRAEHHRIPVPISVVLVRVLPPALTIDESLHGRS